MDTSPSSPCVCLRAWGRHRSARAGMPHGSPRLRHVRETTARSSRMRTEETPTRDPRGDGAANSNPRRRHRRDVMANRLRRMSRPRTPRSRSSTTTTPRVPAGPAVRPVRAGRRRATSSGRASGSCTAASVRRGRDRPRRHREPTRSTSATARRSPTTCWSSPPARGWCPEETEGLTGPGWMRDGLHLLHARGRDGAGRRAPRSTAAGWSSTSSTCRSSARSRRWSSLPRRLVLRRARHPRPDRARLRHAARRRVHEAGRVGAAGRAARRRRASSW